MYIEPKLTTLSLEFEIRSGNTEIEIQQLLVALPK